MSNFNRRDFISLSSLVLAGLLSFRKSAWAGDMPCSPTIGKDLPPRFPRRIVPENIDIGDWSQLKSLFDQLEHARITTVAELESWLLDGSALASALYEEGTVRHIATTCHTDNKACEKRYMDFMNKIAARAIMRNHKLQKKYAGLAVAKELPKDKYFVLDRSMRNSVELFRYRNLLPELQLEKLSVKYRKITGDMTVQFDGKEQTFYQMWKYLDLTDRSVRQSAWEAVMKRRLQDREALDDLFNRMLNLRQYQARNAGFADYRGYAFRSLERFDYGVPECEQFHRAVEQVVVPLRRQLQRDRQKALGLAQLRPWDGSVDLEGRPPLRPFVKSDQLVKGCTEILSKVHPDFGAVLAFLNAHELLDLESRKGKALGGYQAYLDEHRLPFIFMNAVGMQGDVSTLLHESGHAVHSMECRNEPLFDYRSAGPEFSEVASMTMEHLGSDYYEVFYNPTDADRARRGLLEGDVSLLCWIATIDAFQQWIYTHPKHSIAERQDAWLAILKRFGGIEDWTGYEDAQKNQWQLQTHVFVSPFYYIEYGIALLGALQIWMAARKDKSAALAAFRKGLALGGSRPLPELFSAAGLRFDFSEQTLAPLMEEIAKRLKV